MFRYEDGKDITEEEFQTIVSPFSDVCHDYLETKVIPNWIGFYIGKGYTMNSLWQNSFDIHISSAMDMFNLDVKDYADVKNKVKSILLDQYNLKVVNEEPLELEEVR